MVFFQVESLFTDDASSTPLLSSVMCYRSDRESNAEPAACASRALHETDSAEATFLYEQPDEGREELWRQSVRSLQEWVCELLIRNQELRMSLRESATNHQSWEDDE